MVRFPRPRLSLLPSWGGTLAALIAAGSVLAMPAATLAAAVDASGLPLIFPLAQPPLGPTARALIAMAAAGLSGAVLWSALFLLFGPGGVFARPPAEDDAPLVRRADAHPDAPPRWPLSAAELGTPPPPAVAPDVAERKLPVDLDQPLAAFDPAAIPAVPREPVRAVPSICPPRAPRRVEADALPTIDALLQRLERGTRRTLAG